MLLFSLMNELYETSYILFIHSFPSHHWLMDPEGCLRHVIIVSVIGDIFAIFHCILSLLNGSSPRIKRPLSPAFFSFPSSGPPVVWPLFITFMD